MGKSPFWETFDSRTDLKQYGVDALVLFALQLKFGIEDIELVASNSLTEGGDDKKADIVYIDSEVGYVVIAQTYISEKDRKGAPANKASDLNTAVPWLLIRPIDDLPVNLKSHAEELRKAISENRIKHIYIWYVHNLPESANVGEELKTVEHTVDAIIKSSYSSCDGITIQAMEVGAGVLDGWYKSISTPILVTEEFTIPISGGFRIGGENWSAFVTSVPARWLYELFQSYKTDLLSANVREYLGSRNVDNNINNGIKKTAHDSPGYFWVFNNGITALVNQCKEKEKEKELYIRGISIVNGAQTVGAIGNLEAPPDDRAMVQVRFINCDDVDTVYDIVRYNNSQNKIAAPDFRSNDNIQRRLIREFERIPGISYMPRRGGHGDVIRRGADILPSVVAGQALAAFHGSPEVAYHEKTHMWEDDLLYSTFFNERTNARHILFALSLLKAFERKKLELLSKSKTGSLLKNDEVQLDYFRKRGSVFMITSAVARCMESILNKAIPNLFSIAYKDDISFTEAVNRWTSIVNSAAAFTKPLSEGLSDGFRTREKVDKAILEFQSLIVATKDANQSIYAGFSANVI